VAPSNAGCETDQAWLKVTKYYVLCSLFNTKATLLGLDYEIENKSDQIYVLIFCDLEGKSN